MNLLTRLMTRPARSIETVDDYAAALNQFGFGGLNYGYGLSGTQGIQQTLAGHTTEMAPNNFVGLARSAHSANGVIFACMLARQSVFSSMRFQFQRLRNGKPSETFGTPALGLLEKPWVGGTTQDFLSRLIQDADLAGNSYWTRQGSELVRLRPDWVDIIVEPRMIARGAMVANGRDRQQLEGQIGWRKVGYAYTEGGSGAGSETVGLLADEVVHFCPQPDPLASFRGMSWLTPVLREIQADQAMGEHQTAFFRHGATPNMVVKHAPGAAQDAVEKWVEIMESKHVGARNAYKTLQLYPGADVEVVGANFHEIDFNEGRGHGETRIASAAGVPPIIAGFSEGLEAATYANYGQARRRFADGTIHPLWQNAAGSVSQIIPAPDAGSRLWYDATDVPFLREDEKDAAGIQGTRATTINTLITAGFEPDSVVKAVEADDFGLLVDSGLRSVQLLPPGTTRPTGTSTGGSGDNSG